MATILTTAKVRSFTKIAEGGEAIIYDYPGNKVLKIFKPNVNIVNKEKKVERMLKSKLPSGVVAPLDAVNINSKFAGYIMDKVTNADVIHELTKNKYVKIANLSNKDVLELVAKVGSNLEPLHKLGITIGDISDYNILVDHRRKNVFFIDVDSWGIGNGLSPDAYTEIFTAPESYKAGSAHLTSQTDLFSYAVLTFNILARIHPFNGTLQKNPSMSTVDRIKKGISILGKEQIIIPKMVPSWSWMSPDLQEVFREIFEKGKRTNIYPILQDQISNSKHCPTHDLYYYSRYTECPICSGKAKNITTPQVVKTATAAAVAINIIFEKPDVKVILNRRCYLSVNNEIVHMQTGRKVKYQDGKQMDFSDDGSLLFVIDDSTITVTNSNGDVSVIERAYQTPYLIINNQLYIIDKSEYLSAITIGTKGNLKKEMNQVFNPYFSVAECGEVCCISMYPKKAIVQANGHHFEVSYTGKIKEYALKYDTISKTWLFLYQMSNGRVRTMVFGDKKVEYDSDALNYNASPLYGLCYYNHTIYDPGNGKIIGTNIVKNTAKEFECNVVDESSKLNFKNGKFIIANEEKIYSFG